MKRIATFVLLVLLLPASSVGAAANAPFDGYLVLDGEDELATANVSVPAGG